MPHCNKCPIYSEGLSHRGNWPLGPLYDISVWFYDTLYFFIKEYAILYFHDIKSGLPVLRDGAILHNQPQIASNRTIHKKSHNS